MLVGEGTVDLADVVPGLPLSTMASFAAWVATSTATAAGEAFCAVSTVPAMGASPLPIPPLPPQAGMRAAAISSRELRTPTMSFMSDSSPRIQTSLDLRLVGDRIRRDGLRVRRRRLLGTRVHRGHVAGSGVGRDRLSRIVRTVHGNLLVDNFRLREAETSGGQEVMSRART